MGTFAKTSALANTANRAVRCVPPKFRGRDHRNLYTQIVLFVQWDKLDMEKGIRWDNNLPKVRHLVGGVTLNTWVQSHLKEVQQPLLVVQLLQE